MGSMHMSQCLWMRKILGKRLDSWLIFFVRHYEELSVIKELGILHTAAQELDIDEKTLMKYGIKSQLNNL